MAASKQENRRKRNTDQGFTKVSLLATQTLQSEHGISAQLAKDHLLPSSEHVEIVRPILVDAFSNEPFKSQIEEVSLDFLRADSTFTMCMKVAADKFSWKHINRDNCPRISSDTE